MSIDLNKPLLLSSTYLGPVGYYKQIARSEKIYIEQYDHYLKQTYRNRCRIASANGVMDLTIPVLSRETKCRMKDVRISYFENWQQLHWRAIESAYRSSPFFEYYQDGLVPFYREKREFLIDFNQELLTLMLKWLEIDAPVELTTEYNDSFGEEIDDWREAFHPKRDYPDQVKLYYQVFEQKLGFQKELSIIDLLFNMGPESVFYL